MTESSTVFKKAIDKQINSFFNFRRIYLRHRNEKSQTNIFNHRILSIHLLHIELICFHEKSRFQTKK